MPILKIHGFDGALVGICTVWQRVPEGGGKQVDTLIYDGEAMIKTLVENDHLSREEALEYIDFNIIGAYVGESTPIICWPAKMREIDDMADEGMFDE